MNINLYNEDCLPAMKEMADNQYGLCIVDPEYGGNDAIGLRDNNKLRKQATKRTKYKTFKNIAPTKEYFTELFRISKRQIIWGCNFFKDVDLTGGRIVWDKKGTAFGRAEIAYYSHSKSVEIFEYTWNGMLQENMKHKETRIHCTQKPVALYKWLLKNYAKPGDKILDTHFGSLSIGIACWDAGHDLDAYEIDKDYFEAGKKRLEIHKAQLQISYETQSIKP